MISDALHDAIAEIDRYLRDFPAVYAEEEIRRQILALREHMQQVQDLLDWPFSQPPTQQ